MELVVVEAEVIDQTHLIKKNDFKQFFIENADIYDSNFMLIHNAANTNDIQSIGFTECTLVEFPRAQILLDLVKNLTSLSVIKCNLTQITGGNFRGLGSLKELCLSYNSIESLPKGLFVHTPNLEIVSFWHNRIKEIDENILEPLKNLKYFNLFDNLKIDVRFDSINNEGNVTLAQLKEEIKKCRPTDETINDLKEEIDNLRKEFAEMKTTIANMKTENVHILLDNQNLKIRDEMSKKEIAELKSNCAKLTAELNKLKTTIVRPFIFTVVINGKDFQVNKEILAANSPVLAKLIGENPNADRLELRDVSEETFEEILKFMMTKNPPREAANLIELYATSGRLEMKDLMELTAGILMDKVTSENALRIITICEKFNHKELRKKALSELNKKFGEN